MTEENEPTIPQPGPKLNREQRRAKAKADRRAAGKRGRSNRLEMTPEGASALLIETVTVNRWNAVNLVLAELFAEDIGGGVMRLRGIGAATGVISREALEVAANKAIQSGIMLPQTGADGQPEPGVEVDLSPEEAAIQGGVVLTPETEAVVDAILANARKDEVEGDDVSTYDDGPGYVDDDDDPTEFIRDMASPTDGPDLTDEELAENLAAYDGTEGD